MSRPHPPLVFQSLGEGDEHVVLLHGFLGSGRNLRGLAQRWSVVAPDRTFWMIDLPGHGQSPPLKEKEQENDKVGLAAMAAEVHATVASWGLPKPPKVVGHSLGGRVALAWLREEPAALTDVVLLDIAPGPLPSSAARDVLNILLRAPAEAPDRRTFRAFLVDAGMSPATADWALMNVVCDSSACRWRIDRAGLARLQDRVSSEDLWDVVERDGARVRCLRGGRSPYVSDADADRLRQLGCKVDTLEGAGHEVHVDALDAMIRLLG